MNLTGLRPIPPTPFFHQSGSGSETDQKTAQETGTLPARCHSRSEIQQAPKPFKTAQMHVRRLGTTQDATERPIGPSPRVSSHWGPIGPLLRPYWSPIGPIGLRRSTSEHRDDCASGGPALRSGDEVHPAERGGFRRTTQRRPQNAQLVFQK